MKKIMKNLLFLLSIVALIIPIKNASAAGTYSGKIYLQVEKNGEAWYIYPVTNQRYYLGRPTDAFNIMRKLGLGTPNSTLNQIPVGIINYGNSDFDQDGLPDSLEVALGTSIDNADTDNDDYSDKAEIESWHNPLGPGNLKTNNTLIDQLEGRILLQVESHGEAWYLNPNDRKRYYLGRPNDAFAIMRALGVGITNENLAQIPETFVGTKYEVADQYKMEYPNNWTITSETVDPPKGNLIHKTHLTDNMGAAQLDVFVYQTTGSILALGDFDVKSQSYDPEKYVETFNLGVKPARKQTLKYDTIAEFKDITFNKGKRIFVHIMISPKKVIGLEYSILNEVDIKNYEQLFNKILASFKPIY